MRDDCLFPKCGQPGLLGPLGLDSRMRMMWQESRAETNSPPEGRQTTPVVNNWHDGSGLHKFYSFYVSLSVTTLASLRTLVSLETLTQSQNFKTPLISEVS